MELFQKKETRNKRNKMRAIYGSFYDDSDEEEIPKNRHTGQTQSEFVKGGEITSDKKPTPPVNKSSEGTKAAQESTWGSQKLSKEYGVGFKLLQKMGFSGGSLGKEGTEGVTAPLKATVRAKQRGLQDTEEKELSRKKVKTSSTNPLEILLDGKSEKREDTEIQHRVRLVKERSEFGPSIEDRKLQDIKAFRIVDMSGADTKIYTNLGEVFQKQKSDAETEADIAGTEDENLECEFEIEEFKELATLLKEKGNSLKENKTSMRFEKKKIHSTVNYINHRITSLRDSLSVATNEQNQLEEFLGLIHSMLNDVETLDDFLQGKPGDCGSIYAIWLRLKALVQGLCRMPPKLIETYSIVRLVYVLACEALTTSFARSKEEQPKSISTLYMDCLAAIKSLCDVADSDETRVRQLITDFPLSSGLVGHLQSKFQEINFRLEFEQAISIYSLWSRVLLSETDTILDLVTRLLSKEISSIEGTEIFNSHMWIFPWLPIINKRSQQLVPVLLVKLEEGIESASLTFMLENYEDIVIWKNFISSDEWSILKINHLITRIRSGMSKMTIEPNDQNTEALEIALQWEPELGIQEIENMLSRYFFPKWLEVLSIWLSSSGVDYSEIHQWYMGWKKLMKPLMGQASVKNKFAKALSAISSAISGQAADVVDNEPEGKRIDVETSDSGMTSMKDLVEQYASQRGVVFQPKINRMENGCQVYRFGAMNMYFKNNIPHVMDRESGIWTPKSADELFPRSK